MSVFPQLLAQTQSQELIDNSRDTVLFVRESFNELWDVVLNGSLYLAMIQIGVAFALLALGWVAVKIVLLQTSDDGVVGLSSRYVPDLVWAVIIVILLASPGGLQPRVVGYTLNLRNAINNAGTYILAAMGDDITVEDAAGLMTEAQVKARAQIFVSEGLRNCAQIADLAPRDDCLVELLQQVDQFLQPYYNRFSGRNSWAQVLYGQLEDNISSARRETYGSANQWTNLFQGFSLGLRPALTTAIVGILYAWAVAVEWLLEFALLMTAIVGPLFLGLSVLPLAVRPLFAWLTAMGSIALAKISFNIVTGLVAYMMVITPASNPLVGAFLIALAAPILALGIATGGGLTIFSGLASAGARMGRI